jgi:uncharacterized membrane protein YciS (DUF1049 family)
MRWFYLLILLVIVAAVALFAVQNGGDVKLRFWDQELTTRLSFLVGAVYVLGMLSGWTVVGFLKRTVLRFTERRRD